VDLGDGDFVYVRQLTGRERDQFERSLLRQVKSRKGEVTYEESMGDFRAKMVVNAICDEKGNNILEPGDFELLSRSISAARLELIVAKVNELNRIIEADVAAMVKNSEPGQTESSSSESAGNSDSPIPINGSTS
jgi:hypothetical protein